MLRKSVFGALLALMLLAPASLVLGDVVGDRTTAIISPPGGLPVAEGPSDASGSLPVDYSLDANRSGSGVAGRDVLINRVRPGDNLEFSQDNRIVRYAAFSSSAPNLDPATPKDGRHHMFLFTRRSGGQTELELLSGTLQVIDAPDLDGKAGDSLKPSLDGQTKSGNGATTPDCVVYQSTKRMAADDRSNAWSIYLYRISTRATTLISDGSEAATDGVVDGECEVVTYAAGRRDGQHVMVQPLNAKKQPAGPALDLGEGYNPDQQTDGKGVAFDRDGQVWYQQYQKYFLNGANRLRPVYGKPLLVSNSAADPAKGGNGPSGMPSVNDNGDYIAFESKATDLCADQNGGNHRCQGVSADRNGEMTDVFRRTMTADAPTGKEETFVARTPIATKLKRHRKKVLVYRNKAVRTGNEMQMISYDGTIDFQSDLISDQVKISGAGEQACFRSFGKETHNRKFAADGHDSPFMHVYYWNFPRERGVGKFTGESKADRLPPSEFTRADNTPAFNWSCAISNRGNFIGWTSDEELKSGEANGAAIPDMFLRFMGASDEGLGGDLGG